MGAHSTVNITRAEAIQKIVELVDDATNEELADALFVLTFDKVLDNYIVED